MPLILGIETSCDETGIALVEDGSRIIANEIASQIDIHAVFGGVVPEIASRQHLKSIVQITGVILREAGVERADAVAATACPGLMGSLMVGVCFGKSLAHAWGCPFIPVHHIEGHIFSAFLAGLPPSYPFLALVVSGGHTCLVQCPRPHHYEVLGSTRDDAVGECFDKAARLLGLPYPGGPSIQRAAEGGNSDAWRLPRGLSKEDTLDFSYSGLKTALLYLLRDKGWPPNEIPQEHLADLAASFQHAAVDILITRTRRALEMTGAQRLVLAGGVAANRLLRERLGELGVETAMPPMKLCVDNGAMIAAAGHSRFLHGCVGDSRAIPHPSTPLTAWNLP